MANLKFSSRVLRAAVEGEAFVRGGVVFGLGAAPLGGPLRLRDEHPILAVLLLPHGSDWAKTARVSLLSGSS